MVVHTAEIEVAAESLVIRCCCGWERSLGPVVDLVDFEVAMTRHACDVVGRTPRMRRLPRLLVPSPRPR